jgi:sec-independent protein translocase protein TatA
MGWDSPEKILIVLLIGVIVFAPTRIPQLGRALGESVRGFKDEIDK